MTVLPLPCTMDSQQSGQALAVHHKGLRLRRYGLADLGMFVDVQIDTVNHNSPSNCLLSLPASFQEHITDLQRYTENVVHPFSFIVKFSLSQEARGFTVRTIIRGL